VPAVGNVVLQVAIPEKTDWAAQPGMALPAILKLTVPVGAVVPLVVMVAVTVVVAPTTVGLGETVRAVVDEAAATLIAKLGEVEAV
jgi:hypothetical protein